MTDGEPVGDRLSDCLYYLEKCRRGTYYDKAEHGCSEAEWERRRRVMVEPPTGSATQ
jgi:hypothetical protein